jgi:pectinesterase
LKLIAALLLISGSAAICGHADIVVDRGGNGDFKTITEAIEALPMFAYQRTIIFIRSGVYEEKLRLDQNYLTLRGENRDSTIIRFSILRSAWDKDKDHLGPAVINIYGDDIVLDKLTIENTQPEIGPHAFAIYGKGTRTIITNCNVLSKGGDTVSLWNYKEGMYYHADCYFEGAVDFVCPRGWCFIRDSKFYQIKKTAALWHDGHYDPHQKFVILNSDFDGVEGFSLGRHHYQAQFYLLDCRFAANMGDRPIYLHTYDDPAKNNPYYHGDRNYFYHCTKAGTAYAWYADNLSKAPGSPSPEKITPAWTFNGRWNPESNNPLTITGYAIDGKFVTLAFNEIVSVRGEPVFQNQSGKVFRSVRQRFNDINKLMFVAEEVITKEDLAGELILQSGDIIASVAGVHERSIGSTFKIVSQVTEKYGAKR